MRHYLIRHGHKTKFFNKKWPNLPIMGVMWIKSEVDPPHMREVAEHTRFLLQTHRWTDRQTGGQGKPNIPPSNLLGGITQITSAEFPYQHNLMHQCIKNTLNPFHSNFSFTNHIQQEICFSVIQILLKWYLQNLAHDITAMLSWHGHKIVVIWQTWIE